MKPRDYCCCAIPVVNFGIYVTLTEQFVLGIIAGTLSVATPDSNTSPIPSLLIAENPCTVVGAATPSFARWIFAVICYVGAMVQILGFIGAAKVGILPCPRPRLFIFSAHRKIMSSSKDTVLCMPL